MREDLVQAGGGNSSFKIDDNRMVIKASGYQLSDLTTETGYATVNYRLIRDDFLNSDHLEMMNDEDSKDIMKEAFLEGGRPSIETFLHAVSGRYTLHTHPIVVNAMTCRVGGMERLSELFPDALIVPYATPGVELAKEYFKAIRKSKDQIKNLNVVFLQNHGLVVSAETADEVIELTENITKTIERELKCNYESYHRLTNLWYDFPQKIVWLVTDSNILNASDELNGIWNHTFCPDCVVFLGKKILCLPDQYDKGEIESFIEKYGYPVMINWHGDYYLVADSVKKALDTQSVMSFSAQVMLLNKDAKCSFLTDQEQNYLLNWDAEKYRRNMNQ